MSFKMFSIHWEKNPQIEFFKNLLMKTFNKVNANFSSALCKNENLFRYTMYNGLIKSMLTIIDLSISPTFNRSFPVKRNGLKMETSAALNKKAIKRGNHIVHEISLKSDRKKLSKFFSFWYHFLYLTFIRMVVSPKTVFFYVD